MKQHQRFTLTLLGLVALALTACEPTERIWWSPDGDRAAVLIQDELHLTTPQGELTTQFPTTDDEPGTILYKTLDWLPHGEGFVTHRIRIFDTWEEAHTLFSKDDQRRTEELADTMPALLRSSLALEGDGIIVILLNRLLSSDSELANHAFNLALERDPDAIRTVLKDAPKALANLDERKEQGVDRYALNELAQVKLTSSGKVGETQVLLRSVRNLANPLLSPAHNMIVFARRVGDGQSVQLEVCGLDGSGPTTVVRNALPAYDWANDGQSLVYMTPVGSQDSILKAVHKLKVVTTTGEPIAWNPKQNPPTDLATALVPFSPRLAVLPGDKVLFASQPVTWPHTKSSPEASPRLYTVSLDGGDLAAIPVADGDLPMNLGYFVVSPDGKHVAVVESETDAVAVIDLSSGEMRLVSAPHEGAQCRTLPNWRNAEELTFAQANLEAGRINWQLWSLDGESRSLSASWPEDATSDWIERKPPTFE